MHSFTTERFLIRPLIVEDETFYCYLYTNDRVMTHAGGTLSTVEASKAFHRALKANLRAKDSGKKSVLTWAITNKYNKDIIGIITFSFLITLYNACIMRQTEADKIKQAEIGIMLGLKAQGLGVGKEAITSLVEYGFNLMSLDRINAFYSKNNFASAGLFNCLNFTFEAKLQDVNFNNCYSYLRRSDGCKQ